jgi:predicted Zn-dependent protease
MEVDLKELILRALDLAQRRGAQYTDVRVVNNRSESISVKDGIV